MCSEWRYLLLTVLVGLSAYDAVADTAGEQARASLNVKPGTCVALHKGQLCHQSQVFSWQVADDARYCLYSSANRQPVACSQGRSQARVSYDYASASSQRFELRHETSQAVVANVQVSTSWVYRTDRRSASGWRLF